MSGEKVVIFDTTLRDGEQSPGAAMSIPQKLEIARQLAILGVDIIEAGFPISSPAQFEATKLVAEQVKGPTIAALARRSSSAAPRATNSSLNFPTKLWTGQAQASPKAQIVRPPGILSAILIR